MNKPLKNPNLGIISILIGMFAMSLMDVMIKLLSDRFPLHEIVLVRSLVSMLVILIIIKYEGGFALLQTKKLFPQLLRGLLFVTANMTFYVALSRMPLADVVAIFFISPVMITALSVLFLSEKVGWHRWLAVLFGFIGVAIMTGIGTHSFQIMTLLPLVAALAYSLSQIITRKIGSTEKTSVMTFYSLLVFIAVSGAFGIAVGDGSFSNQFGPSVEFLFRPWSWPNSVEMAQMFVIGLLMAIVAYMITQAYRVAELSSIAPFEYISLPLGVFWGYFFWQDLPNINTIIGMAFVVASGLYILFREQITQPAHKHKKPNKLF